MKFHAKLAILCFLAGSTMTRPVWAETECNLPVGPGQEEICTYRVACHSLLIITQQRLNKRVWNEVLVWMVDEQAMPKIASGERTLIIQYLANWFGIDKPR